MCGGGGEECVCVERSACAWGGVCVGGGELCIILTKLYNESHEVGCYAKNHKSTRQDLIRSK